jgi:hypothetical protein
MTSDLVVACQHHEKRAHQESKDRRFKAEQERAWKLAEELEQTTLAERKKAEALQKAEEERAAAKLAEEQKLKEEKRAARQARDLARKEERLAEKRARELKAK